MPSVLELREKYCEMIEERITRKALEREPEWTEALAADSRQALNLLTRRF